VISTFEMEVHPNNFALKSLLIQECLMGLKCANSVFKLYEMSWDLGIESCSLLTSWESHSACLVTQTWIELTRFRNTGLKILLLFLSESEETRYTCMFVTFFYLFESSS